MLYAYRLGPKLEHRLHGRRSKAVAAMLGARLVAGPVASTRPDPTKAHIANGLQLSSAPARRCGDIRTLRQAALGRHVQHRNARRVVVAPVIAGVFTNKGTRHAASDVDVRRIMGQGSYGQVFEVTLPAWMRQGAAEACTQPRRLLQTGRQASETVSAALRTPQWPGACGTQTLHTARVSVPVER